MTGEEARRIVEASTRFDIRGVLVWLREVRWLRAVASQRAEELAAEESQAQRGDAAVAAGSRSEPLAPVPGERHAGRGG
jgi:hypothetical protein